MSTSAGQIFLNSTNLVKGTQNVFRYSFPTSVSLNNKEIALYSLTYYYSWFNISAANGNNVFYYVWNVTNQDQANVNNWVYGGAQINGVWCVFVKMPDGFYTPNDINNFLIQTMIANNHYLIDNNGLYRYYVSIQTNATYYSIQINTSNLPSASQFADTNPSTGKYIGWTLPTFTSPFTAWTLASTQLTPAIILPTTQAQYPINQYFGFPFGFSSFSSMLANGASYYSQQFGLIPQVTPVSAVSLSCSCAVNPFQANAQFIYLFAPPADTGYGGNVIERPAQYLWTDINNSSVNYIDFTFYDQNNYPLQLQDPEITMVFTIRDKTNIVWS